MRGPSRTLGQELLAGASVIFLLALLGIGGIYVVNARLYLQQQLESHAQDAATSLGLSLGTAADPALAETIIGTLFDRGYYERITFSSITGARLVDKRLPAADADVPRWFARLLPLEAPTARSFVTQGWRQMGTVSVTSHPRLAYLQLWRTGVETVGWLALTYAVALLAMRLFLAGILRPLRLVAETAAAIAQRDYRTIEAMPAAAELRQVVAAMNALSGKVRETIEAETARAEQLRLESFHDPLTGLWNRRGVQQQFDARVREDRDVHCAAVVLLEFQSFADYNRAQGYARGDEALKTVGAALEEIAAHADGIPGGASAIAGRWAGATFLLVAPNADRSAAPRIANQVCRRVEGALTEHGLAAGAAFNVGAVSFEAGKPELGALLAACDGALAGARQAGPGLYQAIALEDSPQAASGSMEWRREVQEAIEEDRIVLYAQVTVALPGREPLHREVTCRLRTAAGDMVPAARFLPMAARHNLVAAIDRSVLERLFRHLRSHPAEAAMAMNISTASVGDPGFRSWLHQELAREPALAARIIFEMTESGVMRNPAAAAEFVDAVRSRGARFAIDNFGVHRDSVRVLQRLLPEYVKLSAFHTLQLKDDASTRFFVEALARTARSLDVPVIAQAVEDEALPAVLVQLGVSGFQGYVAGAPAPL